jgi:hypothetical protein
LIFPHPVSGVPVELRSPLPADLRTALAAAAEEPTWVARSDLLDYLGFYVGDGPAV